MGHTNLAILTGGLINKKDSLTKKGLTEFLFRPKLSHCNNKVALWMGQPFLSEGCHCTLHMSKTDWQLSIAVVPEFPVLQEILLALFVLEVLVCQSFLEHQTVQFLPKTATKLLNLLILIKSPVVRVIIIIISLYHTMRCTKPLW